MPLMTRDQRNRSEKTREIADNSDDIVELEMPYELEHLGALYGRSDDIIRVYMVRDKVNSPSADPAVSQQPEREI